MTETTHWPATMVIIAAIYILGSQCTEERQHGKQRLENTTVASPTNTDSEHNEQTQRTRAQSRNAPTAPSNTKTSKPVTPEERLPTTAMVGKAPGSAVGDLEMHQL